MEKRKCGNHLEGSWQLKSICGQAEDAAVDLDLLLYRVRPWLIWKGVRQPVSDLIRRQLCTLLSIDGWAERGKGKTA
jgi:hypothetical protein